MRLPEIRTAPVADIEMPVELSRLYDLAYNLWWTWQPQAHLLFTTIDPERWLHDHNPVEMLINVEPHRWETLLLDESFMSSYNALVHEFDRYLDAGADSWFSREHGDHAGGPIAYFSSEYGWHESLGIYSGGLGILSGDHIKAASDLGLPLIGVGLMYRRGYFRQTIDADGHQQHLYPSYDLRRLPVLPVVQPNGRRVRVTVPLEDRGIHLRLWRAMVGRVPVILLDSDVRENHPTDRPITSILYVRGRELRLCQEIVLGMGGALALRALGIEPAVWHINEGHSSLQLLQRARDLLAGERISFDEALGRVSRNTVFTTHTPVAAGNEAFDNGLIERYLASYARETGFAMEELLAAGRAHAGGDDGSFNLTALAIRGSRATNGVSELHGRVASEMWRHLWPSESGERPVGHVTNGVHLPTWLGPEMLGLYRRHLGQDFTGDQLSPDFSSIVERTPSGELWDAHRAQKSRLSLFARQRLLEQFARHGRPPNELREIQTVVDPELLTIGFARRFATYKRAALLFLDLERLRAILMDDERPVQLIFAGKAHPADRPGQDLVRRIFEVSLSPEFGRRIVFLEDYDMRIARHLVQGVDLWLNTPRRPLEASGTSGMKAAINGALNFSVLDGWWCEGYDASHGWVVGEPRGYDNHEQQDIEDARSLYEVLSQEIVPAFYERDEQGLPGGWVARMKNAMSTLTPRFCASRMLQQYTSAYYLPAAQPQTAPARDESQSPA